MEEKNKWHSFKRELTDDRVMEGQFRRRINFVIDLLRENADCFVAIKNLKITYKYKEKTETGDLEDKEEGEENAITLKSVIQDFQTDLCPIKWSKKGDLPSGTDYYTPGPDEEGEATFAPFKILFKYMRQSIVPYRCNHRNQLLH